MKMTSRTKTDSPAALIRKAIRAAGKAYAPYSGYKVGAALLAANGRVFTGCNVENASYGLTICAERAAVCAAVAAGCRKFRAMAVVADGDAVPYPCGACRQVLAEFGGAGLRLYVASARTPGKFEGLTLGSLLPHSFRIST